MVVVGMTIAISIAFKKIPQRERKRERERDGETKNHNKGNFGIHTTQTPKLHSSINHSFHSSASLHCIVWMSSS